VGDFSLEEVLVSEQGKEERSTHALMAGRPKVEKGEISKSRKNCCASSSTSWMRADRRDVSGLAQGQLALIGHDLEQSAACLLLVLYWEIS
jgi:hypothetical protein